MQTLAIDIESFSSVDLIRCGVYRYVEAPDFTILLLAYAYEDGPVEVVDLAKGERLPLSLLRALDDPEIHKTAYNANFEITCLSKYLQHQLNPSSWRCTAVHAATLGFPRSLADVAIALRMENQKMKEGRDLIRYFSVPCKPTKVNGGRTRNLPEHAPEKWAIFKAYCAQDVEVERDIRQRLARFPVPEIEQAAWEMDQRINQRGVGVDRRLTHQAIQVSKDHTAMLTAEAVRLTGLSNPNSVAQLKDWLGVVESLNKQAVAQMRLDCADEVKDRVLAIRQELGKTSVSKYEAIERSVCMDGRVRGLFQFYGANRTGRWAGRLVQVQNLPQNHLPDLSVAREIARDGDRDGLELLFGNVPSTLSELIRTAFIPRPGNVFVVADFSAIEARVIAWLAGEQWVMDVFSGDGKIYETAASQMFHVPVEKIKRGNPEYALRAKGKIAVLACIAKGQLVLTDSGLIPIENVRPQHKLWDGLEWVSHEGVVTRGTREVITYEGLTATTDHLVWVEGEPRPVHFGIAAARGAHLQQSGDRGRAIRLGKDYQRRETLERGVEPLLRPDPMHPVWQRPMDELHKSPSGKNPGLPELLSATTGSVMAGPSLDSGEAKVREPKGCKLLPLWRSWHTILLRFGHRGRSLDSTKSHEYKQRIRAGSDRQRSALREGQSKVYFQEGESGKSPADSTLTMGPRLLALCSNGRDPYVIQRHDARGNNQSCGTGGLRKAKRVADNPRQVEVYDIRNAGPRHRFTVSGKLVHNCGYGGGVPAMINMGALEMGLEENELRPIVQAWRKANPKIVKLWNIVGDAAVDAVRYQTRRKLPRGLSVVSDGKLMSIDFPSGRSLRYVRPRVVNGRYSEEVSYESYENGNWSRTSAWGGKLVENVCQGLARDCLRDAMMAVEMRYPEIVMHVHDEMVIEVAKRAAEMALKDICAIMGRKVDWAPELVLRGDGYTTTFYMKD